MLELDKYPELIANKKVKLIVRRDEEELHRNSLKAREAVLKGMISKDKSLKNAEQRTAAFIQACQEDELLVMAKETYDAAREARMYQEIKLEGLLDEFAVAKLLFRRETARMLLEDVDNRVG